VPGWTDGNQHDPGVTLLELFAWVGALMFSLGLLEYVNRRRRRRRTLSPRRA
jgi:hypothetical protein